MKKILLFIIMCYCVSLIIDLPVMATETIKIAAIFAQTGEAAADNASSIQGVRIAVEEINKQGGLLGKRLELIVLDNRSTPIGSKIAANEAVEVGVIAIIGAAWSSHSLVIARGAQTHQIPMITNYSTNPEVTKIGNYIFRVCFTDPFQGKAIAQYVRNDLKAETTVILKKVSSDYSIGLAQEFRKNFEAMHGKVLLELNYIQTEQNFKELLQQAKQNSPDILFIPGHTESGLIVKQAQDMGIMAIPVGGDGWDTPVFYHNGGQELKHGYYSTHWSEEIDSKATREFLQRYQHYDNVDTGTVLAYDAVFLLADAIRRAGSFERGKIRDVLAQTRNFSGVTGDISFNENGDPIKDVVIMKIINGKAHYLETVQP